MRQGGPALAKRLPTFATLVEVNMVEVTMVTMDKLTMFEVNMVIMVELNVYCLFFSVTDQVTEKGILGSRINLIHYIWCVQISFPILNIYRPLPPLAAS